MSFGVAVGSGGTGAVQETGIYAVVAATGLGLGTVLVGVAFHSFTTDVRVPEHLNGAAAGRGVLFGLTDGIECARVVHKARVNAVVVVANLVRPTVGVNLALDFILEGKKGSSRMTVTIL